jgi:hypothetical protein
MNNYLSTILNIIGIAAEAAKPLIPAGVGQTVDADVSALIKIAQAANAAHVQITGQPIDLSQLQPIDPV